MSQKSKGIPIFNVCTINIQSHRCLCQFNHDHSMKVRTVGLFFNHQDYTSKNCWRRITKCSPSFSLFFLQNMFQILRKPRYGLHFLKHSGENERMMKTITSDREIARKKKNPHEAVARKKKQNNFRLCL